MGGKSPLSHSKSKEMKTCIYDTEAYFEFTIPIDVDPIAFMTSPDFVKRVIDEIKLGTVQFTYKHSRRRN